MKKTWKRLIALMAMATLVLGLFAACKKDPAPTVDPSELKYKQFAQMTTEEILDSLTLEQKVAQMVQPAIYNVDLKKMEKNCYGSILSKTSALTAEEWVKTVNGFQEAAVNSASGIPYIYGQDDVHGVNYAKNTVLFPHNIGLGAANDPELMYQIGLITADEARMCHMLWNFAPCVAQSVDPRWGRTYESYGADLDIIKSLSGQYTKGLIDGGIVACAKHYIADGNVIYGTGEKSDADRLIDRGNSELSAEEIHELLSVYKNLIDVGVQTIMVSHSALNGVKMHENATYLETLKGEDGLHFTGFVVSDWNSVQNTSGKTYKEQVITAVNIGIDMLMEVDRYDETMQIIIDAVNTGEISTARIDEAVLRILQVKKDAGVLDDPFGERIETVQSKTGSAEYRAVAEKAVEESLVLIKNENDLLPLKEGTKIYVTGPAANHAQAQCGGWTLDWNSSPSKDIEGVTTILRGLNKVAAECNIEVTNKKSEAADADVVVLVVGEQAYAEWYGDTADMDLCGRLGLEGNKDAIAEAKALGKPIVTLIVAGRQVILKDYAEDWDSVVMCYLPGSEGQGVANVLFGKAPFTGKLPSPWYSSIDQIGTGECWLEQGFGM